MNSLSLHVDVARLLERALNASGARTRKLDFKPTLEALQKAWMLEAVFLFTALDESAPEHIEIHELAADKATPFLNIKLDTESSPFIRSFAAGVVLHWTPLERSRHGKDFLWELLWQSMTLGPYPGPWEISAVILRRQPDGDSVGLLVMIRDSSVPWAAAGDQDFELSLKLLAHQFYMAERLAFARSELDEERNSAGVSLFEKMLSRAHGDFAHGVFAKLQLIGLLVNNAQDELKRNNRPPVTAALDTIDAVKADLHRLIKDVLSQDSGGATEGRPTSPEQWVKVKDTLEMVEKSLGSLAKITRKTFTQRIDPPADFPMHKKDFDEVVENLIHNAIKYSGDAERIKITLSHSKRKSMFDVTSVGIVIPKSDWNRIFVRGYRTKEAAMVTLNALGIGLYQARRLAENAGAQLYVEASEPLPGRELRIDGRSFPAYRNKFRLLATR